MAEYTLNILRPSVNNLTARVFVRAAGLDCEEVDVWGKTMDPEYLNKYAPHLTPTLEDPAVPRGTLGESCAIMSYLCNKHGLDQFYPTDPAERAHVDNAMFYLIGTLYPYLARATYPTLGFPQYAGEVGPSDAGDELKAQAQRDAQTALADPLEAYEKHFIGDRTFIGGDKPSIGVPHVAGASVVAEIVEHRRGPKIIVFKKRRRKNSRRRNGHRQDATLIRITEILMDGAKPSANAEKKPRAKKAEKAEPASEAAAE